MAASRCRGRLLHLISELTESPMFWSVFFLKNWNTRQRQVSFLLLTWTWTRGPSLGKTRARGPENPQSRLGPQGWVPSPSVRVPACTPLSLHHAYLIGLIFPPNNAHCFPRFCISRTLGCVRAGSSFHSPDARLHCILPPSLAYGRLPVQELSQPDLTLHA